MYAAYALSHRRYYTKQDVSLGQFLLDSCFNQSLKCQNVTCKRGVRDHVLRFVHDTGSVGITVGRLPRSLPVEQVSFCTTVTPSTERMTVFHSVFRMQRLGDKH
jgi:hypothetical protein